MANKPMNFVKGKKKREELQLPVLHFVAADDWIDKLGVEAFSAWLKFYSWCDRSDERKDPDNDVVPNSLNKVMQKLGVSSKKFYNSIVRPLWNYGLIDMVEYEGSSQTGNKPKNIVVYEYPQNDVLKKYSPLEKIRDYETEYESNSRTFAKTGGRKKKENISSDGFHRKAGVVSQGKQGWFPNETGGGFSGKHINVSNSITNVSNGISNDSNSINQSIIAEIEKLNVPDLLKSYLSLQTNRLIDLNISLEDLEQNYLIHQTNEKVDISIYIGALDYALQEKRIGNLNQVMSVNVKNQIKFNAPAPKKQKHDEVLPEWFVKAQEEAKEKQDQEQEVDIDDLSSRIKVLVNK